MDGALLIGLLAVLGAVTVLYMYLGVVPIALLLAAVAVGAYVVGKRYHSENWRDRRRKLRWLVNGREEAIPENRTVDISVVVPCFNEEARIKSMLDETVAHLDKRRSYEIIVVDDGSTDNSVKVVQEYAEETGKADCIRVIRVVPNHGKGYVVKQGVFASSGRLVLMADADAATDIRDLEELEKKIEGKTEIVVGSRAHLEKKSMAQRTFHRTLLMNLFHFCVSFTFAFTGRPSHIRDTQCGFKLFTRSAARRTFSNIHLERWAFDVELLVVAGKLGIDVAEVQVHWSEIEGSKMNLKGMVRMGLELLLTCLCIRLGVWTTHDVDVS
eukprot:Sspe_Gene.11511::Locus_3896_Transcript_1_1_Confidence_1.000_Length_1166::g.11511::m.11511/K00729/ALG5; dolichyl-phosphate beta-glucosyltransferase